MKTNKRIISIGLAVLVSGTLLVGCSDGQDDTTREDTDIETTESTSQADDYETEEIEDQITSEGEYSEGMYKVGDDIQAGLYKVEKLDNDENAYFERASSSDLELESIIANKNIHGDFYARVSDKDVIVKIGNAKATKIEVDELPVDIKDELIDGIYIVGKDIAPGNYKVEHVNNAVYETYGSGYVGRLNDVTLTLDDIIANEQYENQGYVDIQEGDFAVEITGAKLTKQ